MTAVDKHRAPKRLRLASKNSIALTGISEGASLILAP